MSWFATLTLLFVLTSAAAAADGSLRMTFRIDEPFSELARKLNSEESLRRAFKSQGIELLTFERTKRGFSILPPSVHADFKIDARACRFSDSPSQIIQTVEVGVAKARLHFELAQPVGPIASQRYTVNFAALEQQTEVVIEIYSRVDVRRQRLHFIQRAVTRIVRQRILAQLAVMMVDLRCELQAIAAGQLPRGSKSLLF